MKLSVQSSAKAEAGIFYLKACCQLTAESSHYIVMQFKRIFKKKKIKQNVKKVRVDLAFNKKQDEVTEIIFLILKMSAIFVFFYWIFRP